MRTVQCNHQFSDHTDLSKRKMIEKQMASIRSVMSSYLSFFMVKTEEEKQQEKRDAVLEQLLKTKDTLPEGHEVGDGEWDDESLAN